MTGVVSQITNEHAQAANTVLSVDHVTLTFGGLTALDDVTFSVSAGEVLGLIGPNGAGKTSCFNAISGLYRPQEGSVRFADTELLGLRPDRIARAGLSRTFQHVAVAPHLTVEENVMIGAHRLGGIGWGRAMLGLGVAREERRLRETARLAIHDMGLDEVSTRLCSDLGLPMLKRVEIARALASNPQLLLLDEPANGLTHSEVDELSDMIDVVQAERGLTLVLVEHHMGLVRRLSHRLVVLDFGRKIAEGAPSDVLEDPRVIDAYLGGVAP